MRRIDVLLAFCFVSTTIAFAQDYPRAEVFGGYSYLNADRNGQGPRVSANGWESSLSVTGNRLLAGEADFSGYYRTELVPTVPLFSVREHVYVFLLGPRVNFRHAFIHALVGVDNATANAFGVSASQNSLAAAVGGGAQWKVAPHFGVRVSADYLLTRQGSPRMTQNNFRAAVGIVYSFGRTESVQQPRLTRASRVSMSVPALGVMVAAREDGGAEIVDVLPGSVAVLANLRVGDIINLVDGKPIKTPMELTAELSNRGPGTKIRLGYMVRGYWQSETVVTLQPE